MGKVRVVLPWELYADADLDLAMLEDIMQDDLAPHDRRAANQGVRITRRLRAMLARATVEEIADAPKQPTDDDYDKARTPRRART